MIDLQQLRERATAGSLGDATVIDLGMLMQIADEIEQGRKAQALLQEMQNREGKHFGRRGVR